MPGFKALRKRKENKKGVKKNQGPMYTKMNSENLYDKIYERLRNDPVERVTTSNPKSHTMVPILKEWLRKDPLLKVLKYRSNKDHFRERKVSSKYWTMKSGQ